MDELRQILGTDINDTQKKKLKSVAEKSENGVKDSKSEVVTTDEIVYKDSSTFLKVGKSVFILKEIELQSKVFIYYYLREHNHQIRIMIIVNTSLTRVNDRRILSGMWVWRIDSKNIRNYGN